MASKADFCRALCDPGVIAVVRARQRSQVLPLAAALQAGGVRAIEITTSTPDAVGAIRELRASLPPEVLVGVGTVLDAATAEAALAAGAEFVVSPILRRELLEPCRQAQKPLMLGAYSPTEAQLAHEAGADFVKIFPADTLGPAYIRALRAPLPHLRIVPTGGVTLQNVAEFLRAGAVAVGVGSPLLPADWVEQGRWNDLTNLAGQFVAAARSARASV